MTIDMLFIALHIIGIMLLYGLLLSGHMLIRRELPRRDLRRILVLDLCFWLAAFFTLAIGLTLWFGVGKPAAFYTTNGLFHGKVTLFLIVMLLAIRPTLFWLGQRRGESETIAVPGSVRMLQGLQLLILLLLPLLGTMIAQGVGKS